MKKMIKVTTIAMLAVTLLAGCGQASNSISVISREDGSGTRGAFNELFGIVQKGDDGSKKDMTTKDANVVNKTDVMMTNVSNDTTSIGYISLGSLNDSVKALQIDGVTPSPETVKDGTYKVSRPFIVATKNDENPVAKDFMNFILSKQGQEVIAKSYISVDDNAKDFVSENPEGKIIVAGSSSVSPIMEKLKELYMTINPNGIIEVQMTDSTAGITGVIDGTCDIGMSSRSLKDSEKEQITGTEIALDGIALIVNKENEAVTLTQEQVKNIYTGQQTEWE